METGPYLYLCRARFLRQVQFYLAVCFFVVNLKNVGDTFLVLERARTTIPDCLLKSIPFRNISTSTGLEAQSVVYVDWGLHNQLHALAPKGTAATDARLLAGFPKPGKGNQERQSAKLNSIFPEGKSLVLTFALSKETFFETRQNFLAALASHPELKSRLLKEFWYAGEKIYELYEIDRPPGRVALALVAP